MCIGEHFTDSSYGMLNEFSVFQVGQCRIPACAGMRAIGTIEAVSALDSGEEVLADHLVDE